LLPVVLLPLVLLLAVPLLVELGVGSPSENSSSHFSSRDSSSPNAFVTDIGTHEKSTCSVKTVVVSVERDVTIRVDVCVLVIVSEGVQGNCLGRSCGADVVGGFWVVVCALLSLVASGGMYESAHSVSSSNVAFLLFVTVMGTQLKSVASSGSETSVTVRVVIEVYVESLVVVTVLVAAGHGRQ